LKKRIEKQRYGLLENGMKKSSLLLILPLITYLSCATSGIREEVMGRSDSISRDNRHVVQRIDEILKESLLKQAQVGVKAVSVASGRFVYEHQPHKLFTPASNMKLYTTATALRFLRPEFRFRTEVSLDSQSVRGVLEGNLHLKGYGDPSFDTPDLLDMARRVKLAGIDTVQGDIIADGSYFDDWEYGEGWMYNGADSWYAAQISGLGLNDNCVYIEVNPKESLGRGVRVSPDPSTQYVSIVDSAYTVQDSLNSITVRRKWRDRENVIVVAGSLGVSCESVGFWRNVENPPLYTGTVFREMLEEVGVSVKGDVKVEKVPENTQNLFIHLSPPLGTLVAAMNKPSNNLDVEMVLKTIGAEMYGTPGSAEKGIQAVNQLLVDAGLFPDSLRMTDGSGLSRYNQVSPDQTVRLLIYMYRCFEVQPEFVASLPIGGIDGTLDNRMQDSTLVRRVRAKTGTLSGASALSGYLSSRKGDIIAFSIMMQGYIGSSGPFRELQDRIVEILVDYGSVKSFMKKERKK